MTFNLLATSPPPQRTMAHLWEQLGEVALERILLDPFPGTATEHDQKELLNRHGVLCELVDGTLVVKSMSLYESVVAAFIIQLMGPYMAKHKPGIVSGADGPFRVAKGLVRLPDVSFVSWKQVPDPKNWTKYLDQLRPDLAIEIISPGNTAKEMSRKLQEYFDGGVPLVWYIDLAKGAAVSYTAVDRPTAHDLDQPLDASPVMPGFQLTVRQLLDHLGPPPAED
jgi:Uma2 family endonuclease